jgi:hypothetical protein
MRMTIVRTWSVQPKAGRFDDAIGLLSEGAKVLDRHGAREIRLTHGGLVGSRSGALVVSCEFETFTRHGEFFEELGTDIENQTFMHRAREAESPFTLESTLLLAEVPLERSSAGVSGKVLEGFLARVRPGRMDDALRLATTAFDLSGRYGASRCRLFQLSAAGEMTGTYLSVIEYADMRAHGRVADAWMSDAEAQKLVKDVQSEKAPVDMLSSGLYTDIPVLS